MHGSRPHEEALVEFKGPYLRAMREQAPKMFNRLRRTGAMEVHLQQKSEEAHRLFAELTANAPKLQNGLPMQPYFREAEEIVFAALIEFPPDDETGRTDPVAKLLE